MLRNVQRLYALLSRRHRIWGVVLMVIMLLAGILQVGAVTSIMPFMTVASDPETLHNSSWLTWFYDWGGFQNTNALLVSLGWIVFAMVLITNLALAANTWLGARFVWSVHAELSRNLLQKYLSREYLWFVRHGTSDAGKNVLAEIQQFTNRFMKPLLELISNGLIAVCLVVVLTAVDWKIATIAGGTIAAAYGAIYFFLRRKLNKIGIRRVEANKERFKVVQEAFGSFKEMKAFQVEDHFVDAYNEPVGRYSRKMALQQILHSLPKNFLESIVFGSMVLLVIYFLRGEGDIRRVIPVLSVYAFAGYRLIPATQKCFQALAQLRFNQHLVGLLYADYFGADDVPVAQEPSAPRRAGAVLDKMSFQREIRFDRVTFSYPDSAEPAVCDISLVIPRGSVIALCGQTGSGKTTFSNLLLGLFMPTDGRITVDDCVLDQSSVPRWKRNIGYVPQEIFLTDASIMKNIAFGIEDTQIDISAVRNAARIAQLHDFITEELPDGYDTVVGERGVRLSGGQRQRLGIARALYHQPEVLLFDEATSALDGRTESNVMREIGTMVGERTIIMIAHRLTTVEECDQIYVLKNGRLTTQGSYPELIDGDLNFRHMAGLN